MRMFSLDQAVTMSIELFDRYVAPYAESMMSGELPAVRFFVFKNESRDKDWTATIHLKNTLTISMFRSVYSRYSDTMQNLQDVFAN